MGDQSIDTKLKTIMIDFNKTSLDFEVYTMSSDVTNKMKYDVETPNEFSNGYNIRLPEIIIIAFILLIWLLSLRKFTKSFEKIRTTHYREIPYKYRIKDVENLNHVHIASNQKDGIIFTRDPINNLIAESKLYPYDIISNANTAESLNSYNNHTVHEVDDLNSKAYKKKCKFSTSNPGTIGYSKKTQSHSLVNLYPNTKTMSMLMRDDSILNYNIYIYKFGFFFK